MYSLDIVIGTAICVLIVAGVVGFLLGRRTSAGSQQARELETRLDQVTRDKQYFEDRVSEHFAETATRLNALTENYRAVHEHLAEGANTLCSGNVQVAVGRLDGNSDLDPDMLNVQPPRDYAPKASPSETGMLNEGFGLDKGDVAPADRTTRDRFDDSTRRDTHTADAERGTENQRDRVGFTGKTEEPDTSDASHRGPANS
ncbi:MAG: YhcB family protein [Chromatocurvus sp.]